MNFELLCTIVLGGLIANVINKLIINPLLCNSGRKVDSRKSEVLSGSGRG